MPLSEYSRPNRIQPTGSNNNTPVRVSFIKTPNIIGKYDAEGTALSKSGATPGSVNGGTVIGSTINRPGSSTGAPISNSIANGGIYVGWGGATSIGSPNGTAEFGGGGTGGRSTSGDIGGGVTSTRLNGVQTTSWNSVGSAGNGTTTRTWNGGSSVAGGDTLSTEDKVCFNVGKELYVYHYNGVHKVWVPYTKYLRCNNLVELKILTLLSVTYSIN